MLNSLSLRARMLSVALVGATGIVAVATVGYLGLSRSLLATNDLSAAAVMQRAQMQADMMHDAIRADMYSALLASANADTARATVAGTDLTEHSTEFLAMIDQVRKTTSSPAVTARIEELTPALKAYVAIARKVVDDVAISGASKKEDVAAFDVQFATLETQMEAFGDIIGREADTTAKSAGSLFQAAKVTLILIAVFIVVISLGASLLTERRITRSLREIGGRAEQLVTRCVTGLNVAIAAMARGDFTPTIQATTPQLPVTSTDELGVLTKSINQIITMSQSTIAAFNDARQNVARLVTETGRLATAAHEGSLDVRASAATFEGSFREVALGVNRTLDASFAPVTEATAALERLASRDLTARVTGQFLGDHAKIQRAFNTALESLSATVSAVSQAAEGVGSSAVQIDGGSRALAQSASDQAAALEEVSASARELSSMTNRNAASAAEGRSLADGARESTSEGLAEVKGLAEAIGRIKASSEATARIVKTIDEIAFQTNLLALNAAVEAARAGDSGRGFAVVAEEVRSLALRSAEAARSTADLIEESVRSTEHGVAINRRVLVKLEDIETRVNSVGQVVAEIAAASAEQAKGVQLIDNALEEMARRTQDVAANADQSKESAQSLTEQSGLLRELVDSFELGESATRTKPASRAVIGRGRPSRTSQARTGVTEVSAELVEQTF